MAAVDDPYSLHLPPPNAGITIPAKVTQVDGSGNVLQVLPLDAAIGGGSSGGGVSVYRASMAGTESHALPATPGDGGTVYTGGAFSVPQDFTTPIRATIHVPSNGLLLVYAEREFALTNVEDPTAYASVHASIYHPDLFPYAPDDGVWPPRIMDSGRDVAGDGAWRRSLTMVASASVDEIISATEPPLARYNEGFYSNPVAFMVPGGDYTIDMKWDSSHVTSIPTSGATLDMRGWTMVITVLAP